MYNQKYEQSFKILEIISRAISRDMVFPTCIDASFLLWKGLRNSEGTPEAMSRVLWIDPLLAAKFAFSADRLAESVGEECNYTLPAIVRRIGLDTLRNYGVATLKRQILCSRHLIGFRDLSRSIWEHSVKTALIARDLAAHEGKINPARAFLAGLVHDLGAFFLVQQAGRFAEELPSVEAVEAFINEWHEGIDVRVLHALGAPQWLLQAVQDHHQEDSPKIGGVRSPLGALVRGACGLASGKNNCEVDHLAQRLSPMILNTVVRRAESFVLELTAGLEECTSALPVVSETQQSTAADGRVPLPLVPRLGLIRGGRGVVGQECREYGVGKTMPVWRQAEVSEGAATTRVA